jgi:hypothetical protein
MAVGQALSTYTALPSLYGFYPKQSTLENCTLSEDLSERTIFEKLALSRAVVPLYPRIFARLLYW